LDEQELIYKRKTENFKFVGDGNENNVDVACGFIYAHKKYKSIQFCHDFVDDKMGNLDEVREKYTRRIKRLQNVLYKKDVIMIRYETGVLNDEILSKWEQVVALPLIIITRNPKNKTYVEQQKFGRYIRFFEDHSQFDGWQRNNFDWCEFYEKIEKLKN